MKSRKQNTTQVYQSLVMITQFSITMLVPICLCCLLGWYLDQKLGTGYLFIVFFFVGALAGARNIYQLARKTYERRDEDAPEDYEAAMRRLTAEGRESKDNRPDKQPKGR